MSNDPADFIKARTKITPVSLRPDIALHLSDDPLKLWQEARGLFRDDQPLPFWASAWAGGQALARYIFDHPKVVSGRRVLDFASGSGLVAIAAARAGAAHVEAADIDTFASAAMALNFALNHVDVTITLKDIVGAPSHWDVVLAGDIVYERAMTERVIPWLEHLVATGTDVLIGDLGRTYLPREKLLSLARYDVPVSLDLEDREIKATDVWAFKPALLTVIASEAKQSRIVDFYGLLRRYTPRNDEKRRGSSRLLLIVLDVGEADVGPALLLVAQIPG